MIGVDTRGLQEAVKTIKSTEDTVTKAYYSAVNRVAQRVKTESGRKVRQVYQVRSQDVNGKAILRRGSARNMNAELRWKGNNLPLIKFRTNPQRVPDKPPRVLKAAVKRTGMKPVKGAFVTKVGSGGHVGVFRRVGRSRLPIQELYGPAVPVMLNEPGVVEHLETVAQEEMQKRFDHELKRRGITT